MWPPRWSKQRSNREKRPLWAPTQGCNTPEARRARIIDAERQREKASRRHRRPTAGAGLTRRPQTGPPEDFKSMAIIYNKSPKLCEIMLHRPIHGISFLSKVHKKSREYVPSARNGWPKHMPAKSSVHPAGSSNVCRKHEPEVRRDGRQHICPELVTQSSELGGHRKLELPASAKLASRRWHRSSSNPELCEDGSGCWSKPINLTTLTMMIFPTSKVVRADYA